MTEFQRLYEKWASLQPKAFRDGSFGDCCKGEHHYIVGGEFVRLPDSMVCAREKAWRDYISFRDGCDYHVETPKN